MRRLIIALLTMTMSLAANDAMSQQPNASELAEGEFYIYSPAKKGFLAPGANWGTRAVIGEDALKVSVVSTGNGKYMISTSPTYKGLYLGSDGYVDKASTYESVTWTISKVGGQANTYTLNSGNTYLCTRSGDQLTEMSSGLPTDKELAYWQFVAREDMVKMLTTEGSDQNQMAATWLMLNPNFGRVASISQTWRGTPVIGGIDDNNCAEKFGTQFDVYQTIADAPDGEYTVKAQGFYRVGDGVNSPAAAASAKKAGNEKLNARFYCNSQEMTVPSIFDNHATTYDSNKHGSTGYAIDDSGTLYYIPTDMSKASTCFSEGSYEVTFKAFVFDSKMRIGVKNEVDNSQQWGIFDNFRLYYKPFYRQVYDDSLRAVAKSLLNGTDYSIVNGNARQVIGSPFIKQRRHHRLCHCRQGID